MKATDACENTRSVFAYAAGESRKAFTLIELLVVTAILGILLALILSSLHRAKERAWATYCMGSLRQMGVAWEVYALDHFEQVPPNNPGQMTQFAHWVRGWYDLEQFNPDGTNTLLLTQSHLWPYIRSLGVWRCPGDKSAVRIPSTGEVLPRVRSVSINNWLGTDYIWNSDAGGSFYRPVRKLTDMTTPSPAQTYVFLDEREDSINDGYFVVSMNEAGSSARVVDFPGNYHGGAANLIFADGHAEFKHWVDPRTVPPLIRSRNLQLNVASPNNIDVQWLQERATGRFK